MRIEQSFTIPVPPAQVWEFFNQRAELVGMCIPGAHECRETGPDRYKLLVTQKVGSMGATFDLKARIKAREEPTTMHMSANGRSVKGARGDLRSQVTVALQGAEGATRVDIVADVALGGALGSLGQKVIVGEIEKVAAAFSAELARVIRRDSQGKTA